MSQETMRKRTIQNKSRKGMSATDIILVGVLLAAGAVLKLFVGAFFTAGMKTQFHNRYVLPGHHPDQAAPVRGPIIGILAGVISQFFPGTPTEPDQRTHRGVIMHLLMLVPIRWRWKISFKPVFATFIATLCSGFPSWAPSIFCSMPGPMSRLCLWLSFWALFWGPRLSMP